MSRSANHLLCDVQALIDTPEGSIKAHEVEALRWVLATRAELLAACRDVLPTLPIRATARRGRLSKAIERATK